MRCSPGSEARTAAVADGQAPQWTVVGDGAEQRSAWADGQARRASGVAPMS